MVARGMLAFVLASAVLGAQAIDYKKAVESALSTHKECSGQACYQPRIEKEFKRWAKNGITKKNFKISLDKVERSRMTHYQIIGGKLYRTERCMFEPRCKGVEYFIHWLLEEDKKGLSKSPLPDMEFVLNTRDNPQSYRPNDLAPIFSFSVTPQNGDIMYPAWTFWSGGPSIWPLEKERGGSIGRWDLKRVSISKAAKKWPWEKKKPVGFFRGSRTTHERDALVLLSRKKPQLVEAAYTKHGSGNVQGTYEEALGEKAAGLVPLEDHCKYRFLFNFRGVAASFRLKHLFLCDSLVFHVGDEWLEFFYPPMKPWVHYVPVKQDLSDAEALLAWAQDPANDEIVRGIAKRGADFIRNNLKNSDVKEYWRAQLTKYGELTRWTPKKSKGLKKKTKDKADRRRGLEEMTFPGLDGKEEL